MIEFRNGRPYGAQEEMVMDGYYLTVKEFAQAYGVSESCVYQWKSRGVIDAVNYEGRAYVRAKTQIRLRKFDKKRQKRC